MNSKATTPAIKTRMKFPQRANHNKNQVIDKSQQAQHRGSDYGAAAKHNLHVYRRSRPRETKAPECINIDKIMDSYNKTQQNHFFGVAKTLIKQGAAPRNGSLNLSFQ
jgi:hypothetical protein